MKRILLGLALITTLSHATDDLDAQLQRARLKVMMLEHPEIKEQLKAKREALKAKQKAEREALKAKQKAETKALKNALVLR